MTDGCRLLAERIASIPGALRRIGGAPNPPLSLGGRPIRRVLTTGIGSSRGHARFLADRLAALGLVAEFVPSTSLAVAPLHSEDEVLVVFSQGVSPNARPLIASANRWAKVILVTGAREDDARPEVGALLRDFRLGGGIVRSIPAADEFGLIVRVVGPMVGYLECFRIAAALGRDLGGSDRKALDLDEVIRTIERASAKLDAIFPDVDRIGGDVALLALGSYGELSWNLRLKLLETMLIPFPPVWDLLEFAHGPFQQLHDRRATLFALIHAGDALEATLLSRIERMLVPERHAVIRLDSTLPGSLAIFEHEALLNELGLRFATRRGIDPANWPGRGHDRSVYDSADWLAEGRERPVPRRPFEIAAMTRPEIERAFAAGRTTAVIALGATEQHGEHLPLDTDTRIATALAARFCARIPEAIALPPITIGASSEHLDFAGTLTLREATLVAVIRDVLEPLTGSGFRKAFVFSAHGGNFVPLANALEELRRAAAPLELEVFADFGALHDELVREAAADGISAEVAGHHAGESETSMMLALDPSAVRRDAMAAGYVEPTADPQSLFYPRLRANAPSGVVGDPTVASAARGERYLAVWTDLLVAAYLGEKNQR